MEVNIWTDFRS